MVERGFTARLASLEIPGRDPAALAAFYEEVFGWTSGPPAKSGVWRPLDVGEVEPGGLVAAAITTHEELGADQAVAVIDVSGVRLEAVLSAIVAAGGRVESPARPIGDRGSFALFRDPADNVLGLWASGRRG